MARHVLIAGASGLVGQAALLQFSRQQDIEVTAVSRREPFESGSATFRSVDLGDAEACRATFGAMKDVTHLVFAALYEKPGLVAGWLERDQIETNQRMLENLFEPLRAASPGLRHVTLLQGTKAYGVHVRPLAVPAREGRSEFRDAPNFYWTQEDYLRSRQQGQDWRFTILRPQIIFGLSIGAAMNLIPAIGVYAALQKERGAPLHYPGGASPVLEAVDAELLARVIDWAGNAEKAKNEIFNVTNGDVFVWQNIWPAIAEALGMQIGDPAPVSLASEMSGRDADWEAIRKKYRLVSPGLHDFVGESFHYADFCMAHGFAVAPPPALVSTVKLRQAGFTDSMDTEEMFRRCFLRFQQAGLLPPLP